MSTPLEARRLLGVSDRASEADITRRWRQLAYGTHPDQGGDAAAFRALAAAYVVALDDRARTEAHRAASPGLTTHTTSFSGRLRRVRRAIGSLVHRPARRGRSRLLGGSP